MKSKSTKNLQKRKTKLKPKSKLFITIYCILCFFKEQIFGLILILCISQQIININVCRADDTYVAIHSSGFREFLLKPELLRAIADCGFEHPSEGMMRFEKTFWFLTQNNTNNHLFFCRK